MLLPLSSASWPRSSPDGVVDLRFEYALDTPGHGSATVLASSRAKPDSLNPTKIISESTLSLLSRPYSSSSTESSCECSETSSVDENFQCGSGSPRIGPTMELNAANWVRSESPSPDNVTAATDGDDLEFSLIPATSDVKMIIPLTPTTGVEQPPWTLSPQPREQMVFDDNNLVEGSLPACTVQKELTVASDNREEASLVAQSTAEVCTSQNEVNAERLNLIAPTSVDSAVQTTLLDGTTSPQSECMEPSTASITEAPIKRRRSSLSAFGGHACSTCHLYAPSTSPTFYLDAWLKQQNYERNPEQSAFPRKKVSWPSTTAELRKVVVVERWIERGVHVHPQPTSRNQYDDDSDSDDDEEIEPKRIEAVDTQVKTTAKPEEKRQSATSNEIARDSDNDSVASVTSGQEETLTTPAQSTLQQITRSNESSIKTSKASSTTSSSSNSSSTSTTPSSVTPSTDMPAAKSPNSVQQQQQKPTQQARAQAASPAPTPKKKYNSGIKVTVIGGPYSEHEAAVRIRGADPIKHRAMIENYWQF